MSTKIKTTVFLVRTGDDLTLSDQMHSGQHTGRRDIALIERGEIAEGEPIPVLQPRAGEVAETQA